MKSGMVARRLRATTSSLATALASVAAGLPPRQAGRVRHAKGWALVPALFAGLLLSAAPRLAAASDLLTFQGTLHESGAPVAGTRSVEVAICDAESGGTCYGTGSQGVTVVNGIFKTTFTWPGGAGLSGWPWYRELRVGGEALSPRELITSLPYSLFASSGTDPSKVLKTGDTMSGNLAMGGNKVTGLADPTSAQEAATKAYVDSWSGPCVNPADPSDEMVAVGDICVDKYEASVWSTQTGGTQYGGAADDYPCGNNGQDCAQAGTKIYARSVSGVTPSRYITWFQAAAACENAGKRLLSNAEWQSAARGTPDPGAGVAFPGCNVNTHVPSPSVTGGNTGCRSSYDVENMVGSLWEWVGDWYIAGQHYNGVPTNWGDGTLSTTHWPDATYGADGSWNVAGRSYDGGAYKTGLPAAAFRGGNWGSGSGAGVFAFSAVNGPSCSYNNFGFRCGRGR